MSADEEQNRRLDRVEDDVGKLKEKVTELDKTQALVAQSVENLGEQFSTGMTNLGDVLALRDKEAAEARQLEAKAKSDEALAKDKRNAAKREDSKWWWGKVFAIVTSVVTLASAGGGVAYYQMDDKAEAAPVEIAPAPTPAPESE